MEEEQNQPKEGVLKKLKNKTVPTRLGLLIILLVAVANGAIVLLYMNSYTPPEAFDVSGLVGQMQERREVKNELPSEYEIKADGVYYDGDLIEKVDRKGYFVHRGRFYLNNEKIDSVDIVIPEDIPADYYSEEDLYYTGKEDAIEYQLGADTNIFQIKYLTRCGEEDISENTITITPLVYKMFNGDVLIFVNYLRDRQNVCGRDGAYMYSIFDIYLLNPKEHLLTSIFQSVDDPATLFYEYGVSPDVSEIGAYYFFSNDLSQIETEINIMDQILPDKKYYYDYEHHKYIWYAGGERG